MTDTGLVAAAAHHEAAHACATIVAFRSADWLPRPPPPLPVRHIEITQDDDGRWNGCCRASQIYSTEWGEHRIAPRYRDLMEWQVTVDLAGGIAEAVLRDGTEDASEALRFAIANCGMRTDLARARAVLADLGRLTGVRHDAHHFATRTLELLKARWPAVKLVASGSRTTMSRALSFCAGSATPSLPDSSSLRPKNRYGKA